jgi:hypothetical protein
MRVAAVAMLLAFAVLFVAAPAGSGDDEARIVALHNIKNDLGAAHKAEILAYLAFKRGRVPEGIADLKVAEKSVQEAEPAIYYVNAPRSFDEIFPRDPWKNVALNWELVGIDDQKAMGPNLTLALRDRHLGDAIEKKNDLIELVTNELEHPPCEQLTDLRGPITVNGQAQGRATLTVEVSCTRPVEEVDLVLPGLTVDEMQPDQGDKAQLKGKIIKLLGDGTSKQVGVVVQTTPDPAGGDKVEDVVEIKGDSYDYFVETM